MINYLSQIDRKILRLIWNIRYNPIETGNQKIPAIAISILHSSESYTQCNNKGNRNMNNKKESSALFLIVFHFSF